MSDELKVWVGTLEDVDVMMELAIEGCYENSFVKPNHERLLREIWPALSRENGIVGFVGVPGEKPQGAILLRICHVWYSDDEILEERAVFIHPVTHLLPDSHFFISKFLFYVFNRCLN